MTQTIAQRIDELVSAPLDEYYLDPVTATTSNTAGIVLNTVCGGGERPGIFRLEDGSIQAEFIAKDFDSIVMMNFLGHSVSTEFYLG